jgi:hypothetical protein
MAVKDRPSGMKDTIAIREASASDARALLDLKQALDHNRRYQGRGKRRRP